MESKKVLFVDDEESARTFVTLATEAYDAPFVVETASTVKDAVEKLNTVKYDALVLDISLPGLNGSTLAIFVRKAFTRLPIAFLTAYDSKFAKEVADNEVEAEYWTKTDKLANFETIQACVEFLIQGKSCDGTRYVVDLNAPEGTGIVEIPDELKPLIEG